MSSRADPEFYAWLDEAHGVEAYVAALSTLFEPVVREDERLHGCEAEISTADGVSRTARSLEDVLDAVHAALQRGHGATARIPVRMCSQGWVADLNVSCALPRNRSAYHGCWLSLTSGSTHLMPKRLEVAASHERLQVHAGAAMLARFALQDLEKIFLGLCAPDAHARVTTGAYTVLDKLYETTEYDNVDWLSPLEMAATYNGEQHVARDVALSWLYLLNGNAVGFAADLSLDALAARVEAAPKGTTVGVASRATHVIKHAMKESAAFHQGGRHGLSPGFIRHGPRSRFPEDDELSREQVLAVLKTPKETLLDALEAAAVPDDEWLDAEKLALDVIEAKMAGEPTVWIDVDKGAQRSFLEQHAPYHIRRLDNGGVMLATHPYRHLWPLWSDALALLGIRPRS